MDGLSKQLASPCVFWVTGDSGPAMCEQPFLQGACSYDDCFIACQSGVSITGCHGVGNC